MKDDQLMAHLLYLKLAYFQEHHQSLAQEAVEKNWTQLDFLSRLAEGEAFRRKDRATQRRLQAARFPVLKTLEQFNWTWPKKINRTQVQNLFRLAFLKDKANVIFMGGAGLGKTHLATHNHGLAPGKVMPGSDVAGAPPLLQELLDHAKGDPETVGNLSASAFLVVIAKEDSFTEIQRERAHVQTIPCSF